MDRRNFDASDNNCPHCNVNGSGVILDDFSGMKSRETLIECMNCNSLYKVYYKFDRIVKLIEKVKSK